ncbi:DUF2170 family protein [Gynuella sp.]|uniref:DUF2170 family protein n=1 Tax=Gynuella sp. TaxID=2969146 RepID=UPI003D0A2795
MTWDLTGIESLISKHEGWSVQNEDSCLRVANEDGLDAYIAVSGAQIIVESILFAKKQVKNTAALNEEILKTHQIFPLTTIGISTIDGEEYYTCFGSLSSQSKEESIVIEVETLFDNITGFLNAYDDYLTE